MNEIIKRKIITLTGLTIWICFIAGTASAQNSPPYEPSSGRTSLAFGNLPAYLQDRGTGIQTSLFGTYINRGQLLIFPFFEYSRDNNREYQPAKLGFGLNEDFRGKYRDSREQFFIAYGLTDRMALEFEGAVVRASLEKSATDSSATPAKIEENGVADLEGQVRFRLLTEGNRKPEIFGFLEITAPFQKDKVLIGERDWDFRPGLGIIKGFSWGTLIFRTDVEYNREAKGLDFGETSVEYLKRLLPAWCVYLGIEGGETGAMDEWGFNSGVSWRINDLVLLKFDNAVGISAKATDWEPRLGVIFSLRPR